MSQVSVGESVRTDFQPDNHCMQFVDGADARVVNVAVYHEGRDEQVECCVQPMQDSYYPPERLQPLSFCLKLLVVVSCLALFYPADGTLSIPSRKELNAVGDEQVAGH